MSTVKDLFQSADWKSEKHVPVIEVVQGEEKVFRVTVQVGKEIPHPNTTEHHIGWIKVYFQPQGEKFPYQVGSFKFSAHGASIQGPNTSTIYTEPIAIAQLKTEKSGTIYATSYCNIHGLWENTKELKTE